MFKKTAMKFELKSNFCRVCLQHCKKQRSLLKILDTEDEEPIKMLGIIIGVDTDKSIINNELEPQYICKNCELSLSLAYEFRLKALRSHRIIEKYYSKINNKTPSTTKQYELRSEENTINVIKYNKEDNEDCNMISNIKDENIEIADNEPEVDENYEYLDVSFLDWDVADEDSPEIQYIHSEDIDNDVDDNATSVPSNLNDEQSNTNADILEEVLDPEEHIDIQSNDGYELSEAIGEIDDMTQKSEDSAEMYIEEIGDYKIKMKPKVDNKIKGGVKRKHVKRGRKDDPNASYICDICGNIYSKRGRMMEHRQRHNKELRYSCELCDKKFHLRENLRKHMYSHTGGKPFQCSFCSRTFFYKSVKNAHEAVHQGHKPHVCEVCHKAFAYPHALKKHKLIHAEIKLYHCKFCAKDFRLAHHMKQHIETKLHQSAVRSAQLNLDSKSNDMFEME